MDSDEIIEMDELVIVGSRYSKDLKDRLLPIYEKGEPMSARLPRWICPRTLPFPVLSVRCSAPSATIPTCACI